MCRESTERTLVFKFLSKLSVKVAKPFSIFLVIFLLIIPANISAVKLENREIGVLNADHSEEILRPPSVNLELVKYSG